VIQLTRLNDQPLTVNSDLIKLVESSPDTVLTLINGEKVIVRERVEQVVERIVEFRRRVLAGLPCTGSNLAPALLQQKPEPPEGTPSGGAARG